MIGLGRLWVVDGSCQCSGHMTRWSSIECVGCGAYFPVTGVMWWRRYSLACTMRASWASCWCLSRACRWLLSERCISFSVGIILLSRAMCGRSIVRMVGLLYWSVMERVPCFVSVDFIVLNVLRSSSYCCGYARFVLRLVKDGREGGEYR